MKSLLVVLAALSCTRSPPAPTPRAALSDARPTPRTDAPGRSAAAELSRPPPVGERFTLTEAQWRARLSPEQYEVLREQGTEPAFSGAYWNHHATGTYHCAGCGAPLFSSAHKFDSGTGWPSYFRALEGRVGETRDESHGMTRTEIHCARCGGHLGHVFDDGPAPTGLRYCVDSLSLEFRP